MGAPKRLWLGLVIAVSMSLFLNGPGIALASTHDPAETELVLSAPSSAILGEAVRLEATLRDKAGLPVGQATIRFYSPASFLSGASGLMRLGEAVTSERGLAVFEYVPRRNGQIQVVARHEGSDRYAPSQADITITVEGNEQLYKAEAGIRVPLINKWFLVGILGAVWGTFLFVVILLVRIALAPPE